ncbi:MAG TPA: hemolysin family protein [Gemmatimonadaceae bacterium]|nr:hemolysin family protein [Gemmatimonadaceae bacterium]
MSWPALLLALAVVAVAMLGSMIDGALRSLDPTGAPAARPGGAIHERERLHRAMATTRVIAYLTAGALLAHGTALSARPAAIRMLVACGGAVVLVALIEGAARTFGYRHGEQVRRRLQPYARAATAVLGPATALGVALEGALRRLLPAADAQEEERETSAERFHEVVAAEADVSGGEEALINGVFSLGDTDVRDVMVPRVDIVGIELGTPWSEVVDRVRSSELARFPVYKGTLDDVVGIVYAKDLLGAVIADEEPDGGWASLRRPPVFIPTSKTIDAQLRDFRAGHTHLAIVSDEYGGTAGLVTIEDVLEEIVGEIHDEYDVEPVEIEREGDSRFWVAGRVSLDEISELLDIDFGVEDVTTVGGLVYALFGRVPRAGEALVRGGFRIVVERVRRRRVERVYFERLMPAASKSS